MEQRVNLVTLGVEDFDRAVCFFQDGLGWRLSSKSAGDFALFILRGGIGLALHPRNLLAEDAGMADSRGFSGVTLAHNVGTKTEVDEVLNQAVQAGGTLLRAATLKEWGGYSGYFADPDGHAWEVAWNPHLPLRDGIFDLAE